jgi:PAS domain S-box-containing protein
MSAAQPAATPQANPGLSTIFVVDDDRGLLRLVEKALQREGFATATASSGEAAITWLSRNQPALMLLDLKLEDVEAKDLIQRLNAAHHCPPFIIITGQGDERVAVDMMKRGAMDYLVKDVDFLQFVPAVVRRALEQLDRERRLAQAEEQVHLIRSAVDQGFSCVLITTAELPDPRIVYINRSFAQATGYAAEHVIGRPLSTLASLANLSKRLPTDLPKDERFLEEISTFHTPEGERWGEWRMGPVRDKAGQNTHWLIIFRDITESKRLQKEVLEITERERQRIGQDLHDGLCQQLAGIELMSQALEQSLSVKSKSAAARVGEIARYVRDAISQTRLLARGLSPVTLESEGLMSALQELAVNAEKLFGIVCHFEYPQTVLVHQPAIATHLYRIAQEAVSNAIKHGKAKTVTIQLRRAGERTILSIVDNGQGLPKVIPKQGMGLSIMRYRAGMISGELSVENSPGGGTRVRCSIPLETGTTSLPPR